MKETAEDFWDVESYDEWVELPGEECPECGAPASERQIDSLEMCGKCWYERTGGVDVKDKTHVKPDGSFEKNEITA